MITMFISEGKKSSVDPVLTSEPESCPSPVESPCSHGLSPMDWWRDKLKSPRFVLAPMVDASELAWRLLARRHGAELTYSPMFHACLFAKDPIYRERAMQTCKEDRPFIVQFCSNDPDQLIEAGLLVQDHCDAVDLNLGCPQAIARRGRYGAFLQDDWELISRMVSLASKALSVPVTCKVRVFDDIDRTVKYAQMLESSGAFAVTVHGRTREQKGPATGKASWAHIKAVRCNVQVPVIANGNIECVEDVYNCFQETGCHAVMTAEGSLHNPAVFHTSAVANWIPSEINVPSTPNVAKRRNVSLYQATAEKIKNCEDKSKMLFPNDWKLGPPPPVWEPGLEYLELVSKYPCPFSYIRGHLFKLFHHCLSMPINCDLRTNLAKSSTLEEFKKVVENLRDRFLPYHRGKAEEVISDGGTTGIDSPDNESRSSPWPWHPPWLCQPYIRPTLEEQSQRLETRKINATLEPKKEKNFVEDAESMTNGNAGSGPSLERHSGEIVLPMKRPHPPDVEYKGEGRGFGILSKRKLRQLQKKKKGSGGSRAGLPQCALCLNPMGLKCAFQLCRSCCKIKCNDEILDCIAHRFMVKSKKLRWPKKEITEGQKTVHTDEERAKCVPDSVSDEVIKDVNMSESSNCDNELLHNHQSVIELIPKS